MEDKLIMTNILDSVKGLCGLLNQGSLEANDTEYNSVYKKVLGNFLNIQHDLYKKMQDQGWYPVENVQQKSIDKVKNKFSSCTQENK